MHSLNCYMIFKFERILRIDHINSTVWRDVSFWQFNNLYYIWLNKNHVIYTYYWSPEQQNHRIQPGLIMAAPLIICDAIGKETIHHTLHLQNILITPYTETEMSSFWWKFHHWLHWKLSFWQLPVQPVMKISPKLWHLLFSVKGEFCGLFYFGEN